MFIEAVLYASSLSCFNSQDENSTRWFERDSKCGACLLAAAAASWAAISPCLFSNNGACAPDYNNVMNIKEDVQPCAYWTALIYPVTAAAEKETRFSQREHRRYLFSVATAASPDWTSLHSCQTAWGLEILKVLFFMEIFCRRHAYWRPYIFRIRQARRLDELSQRQYLGVWKIMFFANFKMFSLTTKEKGDCFLLIRMPQKGDGALIIFSAVE
jgi:hypothetical protein